MCESDPGAQQVRIVHPKLPQLSNLLAGLHAAGGASGRIDLEDLRVDGSGVHCLRSPPPPPHPHPRTAGPAPSIPRGPTRARCLRLAGIAKGEPPIPVNASALPPHPAWALLAKGLYGCRIGGICVSGLALTMSSTLAAAAGNRFRVWLPVRCLGCGC